MKWVQNCMFRLGIFSTQKYNFLVIAGTFLHSLYWCSKTQRQQDYFKTKFKFVDFCTKWIVLPYSESYFEETKCIEVKIYPYSGNQENNQTNGIRKYIRIIYIVVSFFSLFNVPTFQPNLRLIRPLSLRIGFCFHLTEKLGYSVDHDSIVREFHHAFLHENALNPMVFPSLRYPPHSAILGQFHDSHHEMRLGRIGRGMPNDTDHWVLH